MSVNRRYKDAPPFSVHDAPCRHRRVVHRLKYYSAQSFVGRLYGDPLLSAYGQCRSIAELCAATGVKRWELHRWVREARNGRPG